MKTKNKKGFTLAEVLITLTIIGIIAAILFPSILANYTEKTLKAKRAAFVARMSQAFAELSNEYANYEDVTCQDPNNLSTCTDNASALKFLSEGFSKVYKLASVCDKDSLSACDIPDVITLQNGTVTSLFDITSSFKSYTFSGIKMAQNRNDRTGIYYKELYPAGFRTKNGESALLFINPACSAKVLSSTAHEAYMCINMIYDLNGASEKPNKLGEDIWFLSSFYVDAPVVVSPKLVNFNDLMYDTTENSLGEPYNIGKYLSGDNRLSYNKLYDLCTSLGSNITVPTFEEASSVALNLRLLTDADYFRNIVGTNSQIYLFSSTPCSEDQNRTVEIDFISGNDNDSICDNRTQLRKTAPMCVYEDFQ